MTIVTPSFGGIDMGPVSRRIAGGGTVVVVGTSVVLVVAIDGATVPDSSATTLAATGLAVTAGEARCRTDTDSVAGGRAARCRRVVDGFGATEWVGAGTLDGAG